MLAGARRDRGRHEDEVDGVLDAGDDGDAKNDLVGAVAVQRCDCPAGEGRGEGEHGGVERNPDRRPMLDQLDDQLRAGEDEDADVPAVEDDRGHAEDEPQRDAACVDTLDRHGVAFSHRRGGEEDGEPDESPQTRRVAHERDRCRKKHDPADHEDRPDDHVQARRRMRPTSQETGPTS